jgi:hypothetical protein
MQINTIVGRLCCPDGIWRHLEVYIPDAMFNVLYFNYMPLIFFLSNTRTKIKRGQDRIVVGFTPLGVCLYAISNVVIRSPTNNWQVIPYTMLSDTVCRTLLCVRFASKCVIRFSPPIKCTDSMNLKYC